MLDNVWFILWIFHELGSNLQDQVKEKVMLVSDHTVDDTMTKIQAAAADVNLSAERSNNKVRETSQDIDVLRLFKPFSVLPVIFS